MDILSKIYPWTELTILLQSMDIYMKVSALLNCIECQCVIVFLGTRNKIVYGIVEYF